MSVNLLFKGTLTWRKPTKALFPAARPPPPPPYFVAYPVAIGGDESKQANNASVWQ